MNLRYFIGTRETNVVMVRAEIEGKTVNPIRTDIAGDVARYTKAGLTSTEMHTVATLETMVKALKEIDVKNLDNVVDIYVTSNTAKVINNGWHKFWIVTGKNAKGEEINKELIKAYTAVEKEYAKKSMFVRILEIGNCTIGGMNKTDKQVAKMTFDQQLNYAYAKRIWEVLPAKQTVQAFDAV